MRKSMTIFMLAAVLTVLSGLASAAAQVYVVHGIPGAAVDVYVSPAGQAPATPALRNFQFKDIAGPVALPAAKYDLAIYLTGANPAASSPVLSAKDVALTDGMNISIVAHLTADGNLTLSVFANDVINNDRLIPDRYLSRLALHHTAQAPDALLRIDRFAETILSNTDNVGFGHLQGGNYTVSIRPAGNRNAAPIFGPASLRLDGRTLYNVFAVGSIANNTFTVLVQPILLPVD